MTALPATLTRDALTAGTVIVTVKPDAAWLRVRHLLGEDNWRDEYSYKIDRAEKDGGGLIYFVSTFTVNDRYPDKPGKFVYTGVMDPWSGYVRLTAKSAFPEHATRVKVARHVLPAICSGRAADMAAAGWEVTAEVVREDENRF